MTPSPQQQSIFDEISTGSGNIIVDAKAGTGKTTTCVWSMDFIPQPDPIFKPSVIFLAFNKSIATELQARVPRGCVASTFHSLGLRALKDSGAVERNVVIDGAKCKKMVWNACDRNDPDTQNIIRLVDLCKSVPYHPEDYDMSFLCQAAAQYDFVLDNPDKAFRIVQRVLERSFEDREKIDFNDMLWLPVLLGSQFDKYDYIYVDEAQDTNDIQLEILTRLFKQGKWHDDRLPSRWYQDSTTRLIAVGDPHQAIYGFRGANSDSMQRIEKRFSCKTFPLSVSYRCPKAVVREAQRFLR